MLLVHRSEKAHVDALLLSLSRVHSANAALAAYAGSGRDQPLSLAIGGVVGVLEEEAHPRMQVSPRAAGYLFDDH